MVIYNYEDKQLIIPEGIGENYQEIVSGYTPEDLREAFQSGITEGMNEQKAKLITTAITSNGNYSRPDGFSSIEVNVSGHSQEEIDAAYQSGITEGMNEQKSLLVSTAITSNGNYSRENGFNEISVNIPMSGHTDEEMEEAYQSGYTEGYQSGKTEGLDEGYLDGYADGYADGQEDCEDLYDNLTFDILSGGTIGWKSFGFEGAEIEYKLNDGQWTSILSTTGGTPINVVAGDTVQFRGDGLLNIDSQHYVLFTDDGNAKYNISGSPYSLIKTEKAAYSFYKLFAGCGGIVDASNLELDADSVGYQGYYQMFIGCSGLTKAPSILPATTLANSCYGGMFTNCISLTQAPELPATTLASSCYSGMFQRCTSLVNAPELPAPTLVNNCYNHMFSGCSNLNYIKCLATNISANGCTTSWVAGVAEYGTFVKAEEITVETWGRGVNGIPTLWIVDENMDVDSDSLDFDASGSTQTINLSASTNWTATTTDNWITITPTSGTGNAAITVTVGDTEDDRTGSIVISSMDSAVTVTIVVNQSGTKDYSKEPLTFEVISDGTIKWRASDSAITRTIEYSLNGGEWTSITSSSELNTLPTINVKRGDYIAFRGNNSQYSNSVSNWNRFVIDCNVNVYGNIMSLISSTNFSGLTTLTADYTFNHLFMLCRTIQTAENLILPATTLASRCYQGMFDTCTSLTKAPSILPATTLAYLCYDGMFRDCTSLTTAPVLPATSLASNCYRGMFKGCTSLATAPVLPATTLAQSCYAAMFSNCTSLTNAPVLSATTLAPYCYTDMFEGCTSLNYIKCLATDISANGCTNGWVSNVSNSGTFVKNSSATDWQTGTDGIPTGWTVVDA